jgi:superfamily I DNA and/or RNA helicase
LTHLKYFCEFISTVYKVAVPTDLKNTYPNIEYHEPKTSSSNTRLTKLRVEVIEVQRETLLCYPDTNLNGDYITVKINAPGVNENFTSAVNFWNGAQLFLINIEIDDCEVYHPKFIILEPDYLVDISSIAECFQDYGTTELNYIKSKFEEKPNSKPIRLGNFANLVIDELFAEDRPSQVTFKNTIKKDFQDYPFEYTTCEDLKAEDKFKSYLRDAEMHFNNIKRVVENDFPKLNISIESASLEPAFLCELFGIQGRLDILELNKNKKTKIVELKSGSVPFPDDGESIKPNHKTQLYLYYQLIGVLNELGFGEIAEKTEGYILYSKISATNLRHDKPNLKRVQEILNLRNNIIINEFHLSSDEIYKTKEILEQITPNAIINAPNVHQNFRALLEPQVTEFLKPINQSEIIEKTYFFSFVGFIAKEQYMAKLGGGQYESNNGLANLWLNTFNEKAEKFEILYDLVISNNLVHKPEKQITFLRTNSDNKFVNFREGDICVLYPRAIEKDDVTTNQIFKCTIKKLSKNEVTVTFRYKQRNTKYFDHFKMWALERDFMDNAFTAMYRNIYSFLGATKSKRQLILTTEKPNQGPDYGYNNPLLSNEQNTIINKALSAKDYFLLNGPPGTGKTSIIIKELVRELYKNDTTNILLLAYTNRAVDELCDAVNNAILNLEDKNGNRTNSVKYNRNFVRIGNELSCSQDHKHNLLSNICQEVSSRDELKELLNEHRIFISTLASMSSKMDIFKLKTFDIAIIDEASQILEPQIVGILPKCDKFVLIGDYKQLPAIVLQDVESSKTKNDLLESIGLENRKNSLFERLFFFCEKNNLKYAFDTLTFQGRMHKDIALFPNYSFYNSLLKQAYEIPNLDPKSKIELERQVVPLNLKSQSKNTLEDLLSKKRMIYFQSKIDPDNHFGKSNDQEANLVVKIVNTIKKLYSFNNKGFDNKKSIGIIAPFRNQIALIKQKLEEAKVPNYEEITVDTVERYQGSQRDIIIFSFAINNPFQLNGIVNLNDDGTVDRKLNVALTRAKEQLILIGNDSILSNNLVYFKLIEFVKSQGGYIWDSIESVLNDELYFNYFDTETTITGKTYTPDDEFKKTYEEIIINELRDDKRTLSYPDLILGVSNDFIRNNIIEYGRTNFDNVYQYNLFSQEFSVEDKVNLYCFYNMRKHYFSNYSIYESYSDFFKLEIKQTAGRIIFLDFGCGPMTAGIAFNQLFKTLVHNFSFNYIGIDISNAMLAKAKVFSTSCLFSQSTKFDFINSIKQIDKDTLEEKLRVSNTVILNFSYLFANLTIDQTIELANDINTLVESFPLSKYIIVYQNPVNRHHNYTKFKKALKHFDKEIVHRSETVSYKNEKGHWFDKTETFTYEILSN